MGGNAMQRTLQPVEIRRRHRDRAVRTPSCMKQPLAVVTMLGAAVLLVLLQVLMPRTAIAQEEAQAAAGPPFNVAVFVSSNPEACYDRGYEGAIRKLVTLEQDRLNRRGGVHGRPIQAKFFDDEGDVEKTIANTREALADPQLLAIVGLTSSDRGEELFNGAKDKSKGLSQQIVESGVPFITDMSVNDVFAAYPNVFSTRPSQDDGNAPVVTEFISQMGYEKVGLIVNNDKLYSKAFGDALATGIGPGKIVADHRVRQRDKSAIEPDDVKRAVEDLKAKEPDLVVIAVGSSRSGPIIAAMQEAGLSSAIFMIGTLNRVPEEIRDRHPSPIFELARSDFPELYNAKLGDLVAQGDAREWIFEGRKNPMASGWADGSCKLEKKEEIEFRNPLDTDNQRTIERGTQFADMIGLVASGANAAGPGSDLAARRKAIVEALTKTYASGKGAYRGNFNTWSFDPEARVAVRPLLIVILPAGLHRRQLAPIQFVRLRDGSLRRIDTLYLDIDLIRAHRVDDNEKTFMAEFYLAMRANDGANIERLDFANAHINPRTNGQEISIEPLHDGRPDRAFPDLMKLYRVSGRFHFEPRLDAYPFDTQRFSIEIKPKSGTAFLIQPPPQELRDGDVASDDWQAVGQYVGLSEDFVPVVDAYRLEPSVVPFYNASFVWLMKREVNDYFLRVVVPLAFILIVAYVSIFIPNSHFEAIITIQVTALLSAVALYLSLPQLDSDTATLSDHIFLFDYFMVSVMIVISIARINRHVASRSWAKSALGVVHTLGVPAAVVAMGYYVYGLSQAAQ